MKAKVKATGKEVEVHEDIDGDFMTESGSVYRSWQLDFGKEIDWEERRYEIAKQIFPMIYHDDFGQCSLEKIVGYTVQAADALISELRKQKTVIGKQAEYKEVHLGDIIEVNGEMYICKEAHEDQDCSCCDLCVDDDCKLPYGYCSRDYREDDKDLLFKKIGG